MLPIALTLKADLKMLTALVPRAFSPGDGARARSDFMSRGERSSWVSTQPADRPQITQIKLMKKSVTSVKSVDNQEGSATLPE